MTDAEKPPFDATACAVEAFGAVRVPVEAVAGLRKAPGPPIGVKVGPSLLKHADHQTLLALNAVLTAAHAAGWAGRSFADWAVVAAPRFLGRIIGAAAMYRYSQSGAPGVSPLIIPTLSLHAVAGSVSMALKAHGFNYGVGGGPSHLAEALTAGLAARDDGGVAGVWVVATGFDPEPIPDVTGGCLTPTTGHAVALALTPADPSRARLNLRLLASAPADPSAGPADESDANGGEPLTPLIALSDFLSDLTAPAPPVSRPRPRRWSCPLPGGGAVALDDDPARAALALAPADAPRAARAG